MIKPLIRLDKRIGKIDMAVVTLVALLMSAMTYFCGIPENVGGNQGICIASPDMWPILPLASWIINATLMLVLAPALYFFNKTYNIIQSTEPVLPAIFLIMAASNPWISGMLGSSMIMALVNLLSLSIMFSCYQQRNAAQEVFVVATLLSVGSMFQYGFLFISPAYILIGIALKCFRLREFMAFLMGLAAPYWVVIGLGIIPLDAFSMPSLTNLFEGLVSKEDILIGLLNCGLTIILGLIFSLNNAMKLYAGNTRRRILNNSVSILGLCALVCLILDYRNISAYIATFYMTVAVQTANFINLWNFSHKRIVMVILAVLYITFFAFMAANTANWEFIF